MTLALVGGTIYTSPDDDPIDRGVVVIEGKSIADAGRISVPRGAKTIDCSGMFITAGFWNSHVHFFERKWADAGALPEAELDAQLRETFAWFGFTTVFDLGSPWDNTRRIRQRIESGEISGPRILSTGEGLVPVGGQPPDLLLTVMGVMKSALPEVATAAEASAHAKRLLDTGADGIKVFLSTPAGASMPDRAIEAAASEAHRAGKPLFVHPNSSDDIHAACRGGADIIAHTTPRSGPWNAAVIDAMRAKSVALMPTISLFEYYSRHDRLSVQEQIVDTAVAQLNAWYRTGGTILFGTDLGAVDPNPRTEYAWMQAAGMNFRDILASLTTAPAQRFGAKRKGRIAKGFDADVVVLTDDPAEDAAWLSAVAYTIREGIIIHGDPD